MGEAWEHGTPDLDQQTILNEADADSRRLVDVFRDHPAWNTMIKPGVTKGAYRLQPPVTLS